MDLIKINVKGTVFITTREDILNIPTSKLASVVNSQKYFDNNMGMFYFNRRPDFFNIILEAHREGKLHIPSDICGIEFMQEMEFWNLPKTMVAPCCIGRIISALSEKDITDTITKEILANFEKSVEVLEKSRGWREPAARLWIFLEFPVYSTSAKIFSAFISFWICVSVVNFLFMFDLNIRPPLPPNATLMAEGDQVLSLINSDKWLRFWLSGVPFPVLMIDMVGNGILLLDLIVRVIVCPYKLIFLKSLKIIDIIVMVGFWVSILLYLPVVLSGMTPSIGLRSAWVGCVFAQLMRPLLILRLSNTFVGLRVMMMVLSKSMTELFTIVSFLGIGMMFFGVFIYVTEIGVNGDFNSPWEGAWWALITMSTVGYGDMYPHGWPGYVVAIACTVMGLIITAMSIPIISNNFNIYYDYVRLTIGVIQERCQKLREKHTKKVKPVIVVCSGEDDSF
ncbi:potassium voltage-gated channel subfamily C member 3-like [Lineus longissimus]|uniref:potassium voltage-gated channel subfamily C member 3-like n=1 Tax=Lineus longissimus TaxID=88925 RepID=UPI00315D188B